MKKNEEKVPAVAFRGELGALLANLIESMSRYLAGEGFDGFLAWVDRDSPIGYVGEDGKLQPPVAEAVRGNLLNLQAQTAAIVAQAKAAGL